MADKTYICRACSQEAPCVLVVGDGDCEPHPILCPIGRAADPLDKDVKCKWYVDATLEGRE